MVKSNLVSKEYSIAATEVLELLNHIPEDLVNKIPLQLIEFFQKVSIEDYKPEFDFSQGLENIKLSDKTKALLAMVYRNYLCTEEERKKFDEKLEENERQYQNQLREQYNPDNIFKNAKKEQVLEKNEKEENNQIQLIEYKERKWYHKFYEQIRKFFKNH